MHGDPFRLVPAADPPPTHQLAQQWCGDQTEVDDLVHETGDRGLPKIKAIAAYPRDVSVDPDRAHAIQAQLMRAFDHVAQQSGGRKSLRYDLGTRCGPQYVDILTMRLPDDVAHYSANCPRAANVDIKERFPTAEGPRNVIVFLPDIPCPYAGIAGLPRDDRPGPENIANSGRQVAMTHVDDWTTALHEMTHNLGAVQDSAPHVDPAGGHCFDGQDIMCYIGLSPAPTSAPALTICNVDPPAYDCNGDDYFNPAPAPGSYLATHWNVFDNVFLCELATCAPTALAPSLQVRPAGTAGREADPKVRRTRVAKPRRSKCRRPPARRCRKARRR